MAGEGIERDTWALAPTTSYAKSGPYSIAYQVVGEGDLDLLWIPGWVSNVELAWEEPLLARFLSRLASFSRLILFDKRGTGLSDRVPEEALPMLEERVDDMLAVLMPRGPNGRASSATPRVGTSRSCSRSPTRTVPLRW